MKNQTTIIKDKIFKENKLLISTTIMPSETTENENNHEDYLIKNVAERMRKMEEFKEENKEDNEGNKSNENEEEEQKIILKRLYSRYGHRRAK
ncbi:unnamed protein product [Meloidogyne enterolobii]|uniref:Uncharacterized protein n=1 Tax=Meloidogyne enterolobii TaxID=390850 RepID=A0ACB0XT36_MELEN